MLRPWSVLIFSAILFISGCFPIATAQNPSSSKTGSPAAIQNQGSDTMVNLALAWAEAYQAIHPDIRVSVTGGGTGTGIAALINGTVDLANASREIKPEEETSAKRNGIQPVEHVVARDAIAIIVHPENPVSQLTLRQISDIYSGAINNWQEVGGEDRVIVRLSRETNSGTHIYFLEEVLRLGEKDNKTLFSVDTLLLPSSQGITAEVSDNPNAIGYDGLGYVTPDVKIIKVARREDSPYVLPSTTTVNDSSYPIARDLYMYTAGEPAGNIRDYLNWILTPTAQKIVFDLGFVPIAGNEFNN
ncbi:MAG: phosphate-binding protein [Anaerolineae bacterium UTCFX2]|jgi:phosphate transport system substrate-binding protein|nr:phosphate ABC transporter substrate-binding protein [Anaerolineae bacterium]OQY89293.1 MAG: phosphate-binding protein [Anaerolineae bacterium UTCFX2]